MSEALRHRGYWLQSRGQNEEAARCYEAVLAAAPDDWETWNNLGNARRAAGDPERAIAALGRAIALRPDEPAVHFNLAVALAGAGRTDKAAAAFLETARLAADDAPPLLDLGRALSALGRYDEAESVYRRAGGLASSWLERGQLLERGNRLDRLPALIEDAAARGFDFPWLNALALDGEGRTEEALAQAQAVPVHEDPLRRAQLIGRLADKAGDPARAFAAFAEMNRLSAAEAPHARAEAEAYRTHVAALAAMLSDDYAARWKCFPLDDKRPAPVFLVGFPRSGTTLLDTMLMGHPDLHVLEEVPLLEHAAAALGDFARLPDLDAAETVRLRDLYFDKLGPAGGRMVIDKLPLNLLGAPLIHRLFPEAKFIFAARHPCDAVLSCFMQLFDLNPAMANFLDRDDAARLYDLVLAFWTRSREIFPLDVHVLRYEDLVADAESEMRRLIDFLGLEWDEDVLDNPGSAAKRGLIATPSYHQVAQPIYDRSRGRWRRYRAQMAAVLPILAPWAEKMGYEV